MASAPSLDDLLGTWELESSEGFGLPVEPSDGYPITLAVSADQVGGSGGCNSYGGDASFVDGVAMIDEVASTAVDCGPAPVMEAEARYFAALGRVDRVQLTGGKLVLTGQEGTSLRFQSVAGVDERAFVDIEWRLVTVGSGDEATDPGGEPALLRLSGAGDVVASTGCRELRGTWSVFGGELLFPTLTAEGECPSDLAVQDSLVVGVLGDGFRVRLVDGTLILESRGGQSLTYASSTADKRSDRFTRAGLAGCSHVALGSSSRGPPDHGDRESAPSRALSTWRRSGLSTPWVPRLDLRSGGDSEG